MRQPNSQRKTAIFHVPQCAGWSRSTACTVLCFILLFSSPRYFAIFLSVMLPKKWPVLSKNAFASYDSLCRELPGGTVVKICVNCGCRVISSTRQVRVANAACIVFGRYCIGANIGANFSSRNEVSRSIWLSAYDSRFDWERPGDATNCGRPTDMIAGCLISVWWH